MLKKITTSEDIKLFKKAIKKEIKDVAKYREYNMEGELAIELFNDDDDYICHIVGRPNLQSCCTPDLRIINKGSIVIENFMYGNGFIINKYTSDYKLRKVADRIINMYNCELNYRESLNGYVAPITELHKQNIISEFKSYFKENLLSAEIHNYAFKIKGDDGHIFYNVYFSNANWGEFMKIPIDDAKEVFDELFVKDDTILNEFQLFAENNGYVGAVIKPNDSDAEYFGHVGIPHFLVYKNIDINVKDSLKVIDLYC